MGLDIRNMAREASLRANTEHRAVELPIDETENEEEKRAHRRPTRRADVGSRLKTGAR